MVNSPKRSAAWKTLSVIAAISFAVVSAASLAHAQGFGALLQRLAPPQGQQQPAAATQTADTAGTTSVQPNRSWLGYSLQFQATRPLLQRGDFKGAKLAYETGADASGAALPLPAQPVSANASGDMFLNTNTGAALAGGTMRPLTQKTPTFLNNAEIGALLLDSGDFEGARVAFDAAGVSVGSAANAKKSGFGGAFQSLGRITANFSGNAEMGPYEAPDFERVLQLNFLSLSYLLLGDDKAFNVTRRASERQRDAFEDLNDKAARMQDEAREAFETERAEAKKKIAEVQENPDEKSKSDAVDGPLQAAYATEDFCAAPNLASAYVNPLSFYLNGIVYEVSSVQYSEDRETARIAYEKAFQLSPRSATLNQAIRDLNSDKMKPGRLVHVLVGEGFAPTRQAIRTQVSVGEIVAPFTIPRLTCHPSPVALIEVRTPDGKKIGVLDPMANIEGMMLQRQKDREPLTAVTVFSNAFRGAMENRLGQQNALLGAFASVKQQSFDRPDMRSWSTLPARVHAARLYVPETVSTLTLVSLDAKGKTIATSQVALDKQSKQNIVYARATDASLAATPAQLWIQGM